MPSSSWVGPMYSAARSRSGISRSTESATAATPATFDSSALTSVGADDVLTMYTASLAVAATLRTVLTESISSAAARKPASKNGSTFTVMLSSAEASKTGTSLSEAGTSFPLLCSGIIWLRSGAGFPSASGSIAERGVTSGASSAAGATSAGASVFAASFGAAFLFSGACISARFCSAGCCSAFFSWVLHPEKADMISTSASSMLRVLKKVRCFISIPFLFVYISRSL